MKGVTHVMVEGVELAAISIHTPNEGSDKCLCCDHSLALISIHTPNEGSDRKIWQKNKSVARYRCIT